MKIMDRIRGWFGLPPRPRIIEEVQHLNRTLSRINQKLDRISKEDDPLAKLVERRHNGKEARK